MLLSLFSAPLSCAAEMRALPAAFSLAEPMKDPGNQMPTASYTFGKDANSYSDWDWYSAGQRLVYHQQYEERRFKI